MFNLNQNQVLYNYPKLYPKRKCLTVVFFHSGGSQRDTALENHSFPARDALATPNRTFYSHVLAVRHALNILCRIINPPVNFT